MSHRVDGAGLSPVEEFAAAVSGKLQNAKAGTQKLAATR
jgi:hypothetical protein